MRVLGIESSCDDAAAAVYDSSAGLLANIVSSQVPGHSLYGGIVPELASREHIRSVVPVVERALAEAGAGREKIGGIAVPAGPGLIGSLLVGLCFAKSLAYAWGKPLYGADHLEAHIFSIFLEQEVPFPFVALLVSGAADFSFSGLKTSLRVFLSSAEGRSVRIEDIAASFQEAVVDVLVGKTLGTARREGVLRAVLAGGGAANSRLRRRVEEEGSIAGIEIHLPSKSLCTDNAAMVALLGERRLSAGRASGPDLNADAAPRFPR